jgi:hypothetical protein
LIHTNNQPGSVFKPTPLLCYICAVNQSKSAPLGVIPINRHNGVNDDLVCFFEVFDDLSEGVEMAFSLLEIRCSIRLSYRRIQRGILPLFSKKFEHNNTFWRPRNPRQPKISLSCHSYYAVDRAITTGLSLRWLNLSICAKPLRNIGRKCL